jgi:hypothetical protein
LNSSVAKLNPIDQLDWFTFIDFESWTNVKEIACVLEDRIVPTKILDILYMRQNVMMSMIRQRSCSASTLSESGKKEETQTAIWAPVPKILDFAAFLQQEKMLDKSDESTEKTTSVYTTCQDSPIVYDIENDTESNREIVHYERENVREMLSHVSLKLQKFQIEQDVLYSNEQKAPLNLNQRNQKQEYSLDESGYHPLASTILM